MLYTKFGNNYGIAYTLITINIVIIARKSTYKAEITASFSKCYKFIENKKSNDFIISTQHHINFVLV